MTSYPPPTPRSVPAPGPDRAPVDYPDATIILVLGIMSVVACPFTGPVAWTMANNAKREIDRSPVRYRNVGTINAGRVCGIIGTVVLLIGALSTLLFILIGFAAVNNAT